MIQLLLFLSLGLSPVIGLKGPLNVPLTLKEAKIELIHKGAWSAFELGGLVLLGPGFAHAASYDESFKFLESRVMGSDAITYNPGILSPDVEYPKWLEGTWNVVSTTTSINAPLGIDAFGGLINGK